MQNGIWRTENQSAIGKWLAETRIDLRHLKGHDDETRNIELEDVYFNKLLGGNASRNKLITVRLTTAILLQKYSNTSFL